jgi:hypothetical protein
MPLSENHNLQMNAISGQMVDVATPGIVYVPVPFKGRVVAGGCAISAPLTAANTIVTVSKVNPAGVKTIGTITIPNAGSGAGSSYGLVITGSEADCYVDAYETLKVDSDGGGTGPAVGSFVFHIRGG